MDQKPFSRKAVNSYPAKSKMVVSGRPFRTPVLQVGNGDVPLVKRYDYHISIESLAVNVSAWRSGTTPLVRCAEHERNFGRITSDWHSQPADLTSFV